MMCYFDFYLRIQVFVRIAMNCGDPIEVSYYSGKDIGRPDVCCYCGEEGAERDQELVKKYKTVLPMCKTCGEHKQPIVKRPRPGT